MYSRCATLATLALQAAARRRVQVSNQAFLKLVVNHYRCFAARHLSPLRSHLYSRCATLMPPAPGSAASSPSSAARLAAGRCGSRKARRSALVLPKSGEYLGKVEGYLGAREYSAGSGQSKEQHQGGALPWSSAIQTSTRGFADRVDHGCELASSLKVAGRWRKAQRASKLGSRVQPCDAAAAPFEDLAHRNAATSGVDLRVWCAWLGE